MKPSGQWMAFGDEVKTVAVAGLWGCTSVIAVSKRGVWMAHFWEAQLNLVSETLSEVTNTADALLNEGLGMFRGNGGEHGNMFDDDAEPQVFIVTRGQRIWTDKVPFGTTSDENLVSLIRNELDMWWQRGPSRGPQGTVTYTPVLLRFLPPDDPEHPNEPIPPADVTHAGDPEFFTFRGKAMVQYQPALTSCGSSEKIGREAGYRVWAEAKVAKDKNVQPPANGERSWKPDTNAQKKPMTDLKRQDEESCSIDGDPNTDEDENDDDNTDEDNNDDDNNDDEDDEDDEDEGVTPPGKTCSTSADCSGPECAGGMKTGACEEGVCVCKSPEPPPPKKKCSSSADCSGPDCAGGMMVSSCEDGVCVCKSPEDPSVCSTVDTCDYLECEEDEERACKDGKCQCQEKTCSDTDDCDFLSCEDDEEKACNDEKCECQEKTCSDADDCGHLECEDDEEKACSDSKCFCKDKPPPFASGTCNTHIREYGSKDGFATSIQVFDGNGKEIASYMEANEEHSVSAVFVEQDSDP